MSPALGRQGVVDALNRRAGFLTRFFDDSAVRRRCSTKQGGWRSRVGKRALLWDRLTSGLHPRILEHTSPWE